MVSAEGAAALDAWPRAYRPRFALRRSRIQLGPLKPLDRRRRPVLALCMGLVGLSLVTTWAVASQIRMGVAVVEQAVSVAIAEPVQEVVQPDRAVSAAQAPQAAPAGEPPLTLEASLPSSAAGLSPEPHPAPFVAAAPIMPVSKPANAPVVDLGALPVLNLDETAFDAIQAPVSVEPPRVPTRAHGRP